MCVCVPLYVMDSNVQFVVVIVPNFDSQFDLTFPYPNQSTIPNDTTLYHDMPPPPYLITPT